MWLALALALFGGPLGLAYSTTLGAVVMVIVGTVLSFLIGNWVYLVVPAICVVWAWWAVRDETSVFD